MAFREARKSRKVEAWYRTRLKQVSKQVDQIAKEYADSNDLFAAVNEIQRRLFDYEDSIRSWAFEVSDIMLKRVDKLDYDAWIDVGKSLSRSTKKILRSSTTGADFRRIQQEQVSLITSLPREASEKVHEWAADGLSKGQSPHDILKRITSELGGVTESRAVCISRTETARARSNFTQVRARAVGSTGYIWHSVHDGAVRDRHAKLDGTVQRWDSPPVTDIGKGGIPIRSHPGCVFNCRCWASPLLPKTLYVK